MLTGNKDGYFTNIFLNQFLVNLITILYINFNIARVSHHVSNTRLVAQYSIMMRRYIQAYGTWETHAGSTPLFSW